MQYNFGILEACWSTLGRFCCWLLTLDWILLWRTVSILLKKLWIDSLGKNLADSKCKLDGLYELLDKSGWGWFGWWLKFQKILYFFAINSYSVFLLKLLFSILLYPSSWKHKIMQTHFVLLLLLFLYCNSYFLSWLTYCYGNIKSCKNATSQIP